jgi:hypothetical protein
MKMKLPRYSQFHHDLRLLVWKPRGVLNEAAVNKLISFIGDEEAQSNQPFNRFIETLNVDVVDLNFRYIFHVALFRRLSVVGRAPVKSAILVSSLDKAHYSKMLALITLGSPLKVKIFEDKELAAKWLGVSIENLEY